MRGKWKFGLVAGLALLAVLVVVPVASANDATLTASLDCNSVVTWNLSSDGFGASFAILDSAAGATESTGSLTSGNGYAASGSYTIPTSASSDTVVASIIWDDNPTQVASRVVTLTAPTNCTPPPSVCTYTKGFYRNHSAVTAAVISGMGGTIQVGNRALRAAQAQAILNATPGQPGSVTFSSNLLLNLVQQLITAELNGARGSSVSTTVQNAITAANSGITVTLGTTIQLASALSQEQLNGLISPLSDFNASSDCS